MLFMCINRPFYTFEGYMRAFRILQISIYKHRVFDLPNPADTTLALILSFILIGYNFNYIFFSLRLPY